MNQPPSWDGDVESWDDNGFHVECNECNEWYACLEAQSFASGSHPKVFRGLGLARGSGSNRPWLWCSLRPHLWTCLRFGWSKLFKHAKVSSFSRFFKDMLPLNVLGSWCSLYRGACGALAYCWLLFPCYCWVIVGLSATINHHLLPVIIPQYQPPLLEINTSHKHQHYQLSTSLISTIELSIIQFSTIKYLYRYPLCDHYRYHHPYPSLISTVELSLNSVALASFSHLIGILDNSYPWGYP